MIKVASGIHQLQIDIPNSTLGHTNSYLVQGRDGHLLIDTGWNSEEAFKSLVGQLGETGTDIKDIRQIVITHSHPDHYGLVGRLREFSPIKISLHQLEKEIIEFRYLKMDEYLRYTSQWLQINGVPADLLPTAQTTPPGAGRMLASTLPDITILQEGETVSTGIFNFQVLWTPGHSPGHICLYEPTRKILFSGDLVIPGITPNISLSGPTGANPLYDFFNSLDRVKRLDVELVLPGHPGHPQPFTNMSTMIDHVFRHHDFRLGEIIQALAVQPKTAYEVSLVMTWMLDEGGTTFQNLSLRDKRMAIMEALAHLESLRVDGKVGKYTRDSVVYYHLN